MGPIIINIIRSENFEKKLRYIIANNSPVDGAMILKAN